MHFCGTRMERYVQFMLWLLYYFTILLLLSVIIFSIIFVIYVVLPFCCYSGLYFIILLFKYQYILVVLSLAVQLLPCSDEIINWSLHMQKFRRVTTAAYSNRVVFEILT